MKKSGVFIRVAIDVSFCDPLEAGCLLPIARLQSHQRTQEPRERASLSLGRLEMRIPMESSVERERRHASCKIRWWWFIPHYHEGMIEILLTPELTVLDHAFPQKITQAVDCHEKVDISDAAYASLRFGIGSCMQQHEASLRHEFCD